jgi:TonB family protein
MRRKKPLIECIAIVLFCSVLVALAQTQASQETEIGKKEPEEGPQKVGRGVSAPRAIFTPDPEYSGLARKAAYQGTCVLWLIVDAKGTPQNIKVQRSLGMGLDEKAIEAVRAWRFTPAMKDGQPVAVQINVEVTFRLGPGATDDFQKISRKADAGEANAQLKLSQVFLSSHDPSDESRGLSYLEKAAKQGLPKAQFEMGEFLSSRKNDLITAYFWYALAQRNGHKHSDKRMSELAKQMTPEQLDEARRRLSSNDPR